MRHQTLKYIFVRIGLSLLILVTLGFFTLYFIHEIALPNAIFNDSFIQWLILLICVIFGFFAYGLIGEQRFHNAMHKLKDIPSTSNPLEIIDKFQGVLDFTYSSNFLPSQGSHLRESVIMRFADYLLFIGKDDEHAQKIYLKAFLLKPKGSPYRAPLLSMLERGGNLTEEEIDLLLVILMAENFYDKAIANHLAALFLRKCVLTRKTEPIFLSAVKFKSEEAKEIVDFVLPRVLEKERSDSFALNFYLEALQWQLSEETHVREIIARAYCEGVWKAIDPPLHQKCDDVFQSLGFKQRSNIMREVTDSTFISKVKKVGLFSKDDLIQLKRLKVRLGIARSLREYLSDGFWIALKALTNFPQRLVVGFFGFKTWAIIFIALIILVGVLNYRESYVQQERTLQKQHKKRIAVKKLDGKEGLKVYTLQVDAFTSSKQAHVLIESLRKKGIRDVYQVRTKRKSGGNWYKVRLGRFESNESARRFASQLISQKSIKNYFVIPLPFT